MRKGIVYIVMGIAIIAFGIFLSGNYRATSEPEKGSGASDTTEIQ